MFDFILNHVVALVGRLSPWLLLVGIYLAGCSTGWFAHKARVYGKLYAAEIMSFRRHRVRENGQHHRATSLK